MREHKKDCMMNWDLVKSLARVVAYMKMGQHDDCIVTPEMRERNLIHDANKLDKWLVEAYNRETKIRKK